MKQKLLFLMTLLVLCVTGAWADSSAVFNYSSSNPGATVNNITVSGDGSYSTGYLNFSSSSGGNLTLTAATDYVITGATITYTASGNDRTGGGSELTITTGYSYSLSSTTGTISLTGSAAKSITLQYVNKARIQSITVTYNTTTTYSVTYKANNGTDEADVTDDAASVIAGCSGTWTVPTGKIFNGWNTAADGSGIAYAVGAAVTSALTLYAQWANAATLFSMTSITNTGGVLATQTTADVTATFSTGGSAQVFQNASGGGEMLYSSSINLNGSGGSYIHVFFPTKLQAGDIISGTFLAGAWKIGTTTSNSSAVSKAASFTLEAGDALIGATDFYIFKDGSAQISAIEIKGLAEASDLIVTSSKTPSINVGETESIVTTTSSAGAITYTSSDEDVAMVSNEGLITAVSGGTAIITLNQAASGAYREGVAKVNVTVNEIALVKIKALGGTSTKVTGTIDVETEVTADVNLSSNRKMDKGKFFGFTLKGDISLKTGDIVEVKLSNAGQNGKFIFYDGKGETPTVLYNTNVSPDEAKAYRFVLPAAMNGIKTIYLRRGGDGTGINEGFNPVFDYVAVFRPNAVITLNASGYATYSYASDFEFDGSKAYKMALDEGEKTIAGTEVSGKIKAGEGILLKGEAGAPVAITETTGAVALAGNDLKGSTKSDGTLADKPTYCYVLSGDTFKKYTGGTLIANKAYFEASSDLSAGRAFTIIFDDGETTSINKVEANEFVEDNKFYNLAGQQVAQPTKGLYIVNGKKVIIK